MVRTLTAVSCVLFIQHFLRREKGRGEERRGHERGEEKGEEMRERRGEEMRGEREKGCGDGKGREGERR